MIQDPEHDDDGFRKLRICYSKERIKSRPRSRFYFRKTKPDLMEVRGQDKEIGTSSSSMGYNRVPNSSKISSTPAGTVYGDAIFNPSQTLDHHHLQQPLYHQHHQLNPQQDTHNSDRRDLDTGLDPVPATASKRSTPTPTLTTTTTTTTSITAATTTLVTRYRECLKNHAAGMGGHVVDGCGEFMPGGEEGTSEALKCAACECHRSFHRKETDGESSLQQHHTNLYCNKKYHHHHHHQHQHQLFPPPPPPPPAFHPHNSRLSLGLSNSNKTAAPIAPLMMAFGGSGGGAAESSSEDLNLFHSNAGGQSVQQANNYSKKRFRTKFSQEQKDKMLELAEKIGWRIQKQDEEEVQEFCAQVGVKRQVFKVWMHNNKQAVKKKEM